jgi:hypothetical protein
MHDTQHDRMEFWDNFNNDLYQRILEQRKL